MSKLYSDMTKQEILKDIRDLSEKARKAEQLGIINELAVFERKIAMAKCYLLDPEQFYPGSVYGLVNDPKSRFKIKYMNGVFAWGYQNNEDELQAMPISMLVLNKDNKEES